MRAKEVLVELLEDYFPFQEGERFSFDLLPGLNAFELRAFSRKMPGQLPTEIKELLSYSRGFDFYAFDRIDFTRLGFELDGAFEHPIDLAHDAFDNHWIIDIHPLTGAWEKVFYVCHDPSVIVLQAHSLGQFLSQISQFAKGEEVNWLNHIREDAARRIWEEKTFLISRQEAMRSKDEMLSTFAEGLPQNYMIADMREADWGDGFPWSLTGPEGEIIRADQELLFAIEAPPIVEKPKGLLGRFFNKK